MNYLNRHKSSFTFSLKIYDENKKSKELLLYTKKFKPSQSNIENAVQSIETLYSIALDELNKDINTI